MVVLLSVWRHDRIHFVHYCTNSCSSMNLIYAPPTSMYAINLLEYKSIPRVFVMSDIRKYIDAIHYAVEIRR